MTKEVKKTRNLKVIVRKGYGGYEMLAGHNRMNAAQIAGMTEVPASLYSSIAKNKHYAPGCSYVR